MDSDLFSTPLTSLDPHGMEPDGAAKIVWALLGSVMTSASFLDTHSQF